MKKADNPELIRVTRMLKSKATELDAPLWKSLAKHLEKSKHRRLIVNISRINRYTKDDETVTVPGKVLGSGTLDHKVSVAAFQFSVQAQKKIEAAGGRCITFSELMKQNRKGKNIKIIG